MATMTTSLTVPSFASLKASSNISKTLKTASLVGPTKQCSPRLAVRASLKDNLGLAVAATAAAATLLASGGAMAFDVTLGSDDGGLVFLPAEFEVASGEKITFTNNAGFPHNVVFDEDEIPSGVDASKISMSEEDLLNAKGETYAVTLTEKGTYSFYCSPHQGAGMVGKVTVK